MGPISAQWRQIGNAVPPLLGKAIGKAIKQMFKNYLNEKENLLNNKRAKGDKIDKVRGEAFVYR